MPDEPQRTAQDWLQAFAARLGVEAPDPRAMEQLLDLAGVAAHASERKAAPIACWLVGSTDIDTEAALALAQEI